MSTAIPMLDLDAQHRPIRAELRAAMDDVIDKQAFILGPQVAEFEADMARYLGVKHAIGCANGSDALVLALNAFGVGPGDEVVTTTFSFFATAGAVSRVGATPVFVDCDPRTFNIDVAQVAAKITPRTKVIIPVHLFGQMTPMGELMALADKHGIKILEDGAQAIGAMEGGRHATTIGHIGTLSFFPSKNLGCFGDGGMVVTNDDGYADKLRRLRVHGTGKVRYHYDMVGLNSRLDTLQAAVLKVKLKYLEGWHEGRMKNAAKYDVLFADAPEVVRPHRLPGMRHIFNQYTVRVARRDELLETMKKEQIGASVYYPLPLHVQECFASLGGKRGDCPEAEKAAAEVVSLPIYGELTDDQLHRIATVVKKHARA